MTTAIPMYLRLQAAYPTATFSNGLPVDWKFPFRHVWKANLLHGFYVTNLDIKHEKAATENKPAA